MLLLKLCHISFAAASLTGFVTRVHWRLNRPERLRERWVRILPHFIDTGLLATGLAMVLYFHWSPLRQAWLAAKLTAVVAYIGLGAVALRRGWRPAMIAAVLVFGYIVLLAVTKQIIPGA